MTREEQKILFEEMPVRSAVLRQAFPAVASQMVVLLYNLADTYFVGLLNDPVQTAAVTVSVAPFLMLTAISNLFGVGGGSAMSRALGVKDTMLARRISSTAFWWSLMTSLIYMVIFLTFSRQILTCCGATEATMSATWSYTRWVVLAGGPATVLNMFFANMCRAEGSAMKAFLGLSFCGVLNMILDPFFTLPQFIGCGVEGAGIATAISNWVALGYFLCVVLSARKNTSIRLSWKLFSAERQIIGRILAIGFPSSIQLGLTVASIAMQAKFVSHYSAEAVAALGIAKKLDQLPLYFSLGVSTGMMPLLAYNDAAGNMRRCRSIFVFGVMFTAIFSFLMMITYEIFAPFLASLFISEKQTVQYAAAFTRQLVVAMPLMAVSYPTIILFQAMGRAREALFCSIIRKGALDLPLLIVMDRLLPLYGCMWVQPIVDFVALIVTMICYRRIMKQRAQEKRPAAA